MERLRSLSIRDLEAVVALARTRHFGRAAEACGLAQPTLSDLVRRVETALGQRLFERTSRRCAPTSVGVFILEAIEDLLRGLVRLRDVDPGADGHSTLRGAVRLGLIPTLGPYLMPHLLPPLLTHHPEARFYFFEALTDQLLGMVQAGRLDAAFVSLPVVADGVRALPLFDEELVWILPKSHDACSAPRVRVADIARPELILMDHGHCLRNQALEVCGRGDMTSTPVHATSLETLRFMVASGVGCGVYPALAARQQVAAGETLVSYRPFADSSALRSIGLVVRDEAPALRLATTLAERVAAIALPTCWPETAFA